LVLAPAVGDRERRYRGYQAEPEDHTLGHCKDLRRRTIKLSSGGGRVSYESGKADTPPPSAAADGSASWLDTGSTRRVNRVRIRSHCADASACWAPRLSHISPGSASSSVP